MTTKQPMPVDVDLTEFKQFLFEVYQPHLAPTDLKTMEACEAEARQEIDETLENYVRGLVRGVDLFIENALPIEREHLMEVLNKSAQVPDESNTENPFSINAEDAAFLEVIAKRVFETGNFVDASFLYKFIVQVFPVYSPAWVSLAHCEQYQGKLEDAEEVFLMSIDLLPKDYYLRMYAAEFYIKTNQVPKAKALIEASALQLSQDGEEGTEAHRQVTNLLKQL